MDWIKQIIECKKGNWESPGSLGQKIKKIRMLRRYTQKELGVMCGFSLSSADVRIAQYEKNKKILMRGLYFMPSPFVYIEG